MKYLKILLLIGTSIYSTKYLFAQSGNYEIKELKVGDQCPNFKFKKMINYSSSSAELGDFKGKLVILDFWRTWCSPCVEGLLRMDSLERKFKGEVVIIPVTSEPMDIVTHFMKGNKKLQKLEIKSVIADEELYKIFRHREIPHEIWIDSTGKVIAVTRPDEVNEHSIYQYLVGERLALKAKGDILNFNGDKPLFFGAFTNGADSVLKNRLVSSSTLLRAIDCLPGFATPAQVKGDKAFIRCVNLYPEVMYGIAFGSVPWVAKTWREFDYSLRFASRLIWEAKKIPKERFLYEIILPKNDSLKINSYMVDDLNRYFGNMYGIRGVLEKRLVRCWILRRTSNRDLIKAKKKTDDVGSSDRFGNVRVTNMKVGQFLFVWYMEMGAFPAPLVDDTGYVDDIDLELDAKITDFNAVKNAIHKYDLELVNEERALDMVVIKDVK